MDEQHHRSEPRNSIKTEFKESDLSLPRQGSNDFSEAEANTSPARKGKQPTVKQPLTLRYLRILEVCDLIPEKALNGCTRQSHDRLLSRLLFGQPVGILYRNCLNIVHNLRRWEIDF